MRTSVLPIVAALLFTAAPAVRAEEAPEPIRVIAAVLELSDVQAQSLADILAARNSVIKPLAQQAQEREADLNRELSAANPDPAAVGAVVIEIRRIQKQVEAATSDATNRFEQTLSNEQQQRLDYIRQTAPVCRVLPAFQAAGLL